MHASKEVDTTKEEEVDTTKVGEGGITKEEGEAIEAVAAAAVTVEEVEVAVEDIIGVTETLGESKAQVGNGDKSKNYHNCNSLFSI